jgi:hypothetical protein
MRLPDFLRKLRPNVTAFPEGYGTYARLRNLVQETSPSSYVSTRGRFSRNNAGANRPLTDIYQPVKVTRIRVSAWLQSGDAGATLA